MGIKSKKADLSDWRKVNRLEKASNKKITVSMVGKYTELADAYMSLNEALRHGGLQNKVDVNINYIDSENLKITSKLFPKYKLTEIKNAGHWIHHENPDDFFSICIKYL